MNPNYQKDWEYHLAMGNLWKTAVNASQDYYILKGHEDPFSSATSYVAGYLTRYIGGSKTAHKVMEELVTIMEERLQEARKGENK